MISIAVVGASSNRDKYGNKCVRAYISKEYNVFPVNPGEDMIEGLKCYKSVLDIPEKLDVISLYLQASVIGAIIEDIIKKKPGIVYFNPGTEDENLERKLRENGIDVREECSILAIGLSPNQFVN